MDNSPNSHHHADDSYLGALLLFSPLSSPPTLPKANSRPLTCFEDNGGQRMVVKHPKTTKNLPLTPSPIGNTLEEQGTWNAAEKRSFTL